MKISFIIPAYNEEGVIDKCLDSVIKALSNNPCDAEVIVVNNASTDNTRAIVSSYDSVNIVDESRKGLVFARQAGFVASSGDILANIDADTILPDEWLPTVIKNFSEDKELLALSGPYVYYDTPWYFRTATKIFYVIGFYIDNFNKFFFNSGSMLQGGNFILRREALERIGGFDTSIEFYGEDTDIGRRINKIGKVKWTFSLPVYSSGRRLMEQGIINTGIIYSLNFIWITLLKKPYSEEHIDIRIEKKRFFGKR